MITSRSASLLLVDSTRFTHLSYSTESFTGDPLSANRGEAGGGPALIRCNLGNMFMRHSLIKQYSAFNFFLSIVTTYA